MNTGTNAKTGTQTPARRTLAPDGTLENEMTIYVIHMAFGVWNG
jgi:hypothetical protein